jgi:probable phosphoglycerate mutase
MTSPPATQASESQILLMRHPQTVANQERRLQGQSNSPLSKLGEEQREQAIAGLVSWQPEVLLSSPLTRCLAIAQPVADALGLALIVDDRFVEMGFGRLEGLTYQEAQAAGFSLDWQNVASLASDAQARQIEGAESISQFTARIAGAASLLTEQHGRIALVSHGGVINGLISHWLDLKPATFWALTLANVHSSLLKLDGLGRITLVAHGLKPQWLADLRD